MCHVIHWMPALPVQSTQRSQEPVGYRAPNRGRWAPESLDGHEKIAEIASGEFLHTGHALRSSFRRVVVSLAGATDVLVLGPASTPATDLSVAR